MGEQQENTPQEPGTGEQGGSGSKEAVLADLARERRKRQELEQQVATLQPLAAKAQELEDAGRTEVERLTSRIAELERTSGPVQQERDRLAVALSKGLTVTQARRLVGTTEEELAADADELLADLGARTPDPVTPPGRPREAMPRGGTDPTGEPAVDDVDKLGERMFRR